MTHRAFLTTSGGPYEVLFNVIEDVQDYALRQTRLTQTGMLKTAQILSKRELPGLAEW